MDDRRRRVSCSLSSTIACPRVQDPDLASDARPLTISHPPPIVRLQLAGPVLDVRVSSLRVRSLQATPHPRHLSYISSFGVYQGALTRGPASPMH